MSHYIGAREDEVFLGNIKRSKPLEGNLKSMKTIRLGGVALDIYGKRLPAEYAPVFIHRSELAVYHRLMDDSVSNTRNGYSRQR